MTFNGVEAFKRMCDTYLPQEKVDALLCRLHKNFEQLKLVRVKDVHSFFTTVGWYIRAYNKLATTKAQKRDEATVSKLVIDLLSRSRHAIKGENGSNLTTALANIQSGAKSMDIQEELYHLYSEEKLENCSTNLPNGFFPDYSYLKIHQGKNPPAVAQTLADKRKAWSLKRKLKRTEDVAKRDDKGKREEAKQDDDKSGEPPEKKRKSKKVRFQKGKGKSPEA